MCYLVTWKSDRNRNGRYCTEVFLTRQQAEHYAMCLAALTGRLAATDILITEVHSWRALPCAHPSIT